MINQNCSTFDYGWWEMDSENLNLDFLLSDDLNDKERKRYYKNLKKLNKHFENELRFILKKDDMEVMHYLKSLNNYFISNNGLLVDFKKINVGDIYKVNLLLTHSNDTAYIHPIIILGKFESPNGDRILGVPGTGNKNYAELAFHKSLKPEGDQDLFFLSKEETATEKDGTFFVTNAKLYPIEAITDDNRMGFIEDVEIIEELKDIIVERMFPEQASIFAETTIDLDILKNILGITLLERDKYKEVVDLYNYYCKKNNLFV